MESSGNPTSPRIVACPRCGSDVAWVAASTYRPFCSARCKGMDFGAWASDAYRVTGEALPDPGEDQPR